MKGPSPSRKGKASPVKAGWRRRRLHTPMSWMSRVRRSDMGAKLATYSSSDGSPERPVKVVVVGGDAGSGGDGSRVSIPRSSEKIGESGPSSVSVPKMGASGERPNEPGKLEASGGGRSKEAVKLVVGGSGGSSERVVNIGRSRRRIDNLGQVYVPDSEDEGTDVETGLYASDSQEEAGGSYGGRRRSAACIRLFAARLAVETATVVDPAPEVAMAVDVPVGEVGIPDELRPEMKGLLIVFVVGVGQLILVKLEVNSICVHAEIVYDFVEAGWTPKWSAPPTSTAPTASSQGR